MALRVGNWNRGLRVLTALLIAMSPVLLPAQPVAADFDVKKNADIRKLDEPPPRLCDLVEPQGSSPLIYAFEEQQVRPFATDTTITGVTRDGAQSFVIHGQEVVQSYLLHRDRPTDVASGGVDGADPRKVALLRAPRVARPPRRR